MLPSILRPPRHPKFTVTEGKENFEYSIAKDILKTNSSLFERQNIESDKPVVDTKNLHRFKTARYTSCVVFLFTESAADCVLRIGMRAKATHRCTG